MKTYYGINYNVLINPMINQETVNIQMFLQIIRVENNRFLTVK